MQDDPMQTDDAAAPVTPPADSDQPAEEPIVAPEAPAEGPTEEAPAAPGMPAEEPAEEEVPQAPAE